MNKPVKITLWVIVALIVLGVVAAIVFINVINPNQFKPQIEKLVYEKTGRVLKIPGNLSWHFFPNIGINSGEISLSNPAGYDQKVFITIKSADVRVALLPLLSHRIDVKNLSLNGVKLHLIQKSATDNNWTFTSAGATTKTIEVKSQIDKQVIITREPVKPGHSDQTETEVAQDSAKKVVQSEDKVSDESRKDIDKQGTSYTFSIKKVSIQNATIYFDNLAQKQSYVLQKFNLQTQNIKPGKPFNVRSSFAVLGNRPPMMLNVSLTANLSMDMQKQIYTFQDLNLYESLALGNEQTTLTKLNGHLTGNAVVNLKRGTLNMAPTLVLNNLVNIAGKLDVKNINQNPQYTGDIEVKPFNLVRFFISMGKPTPNIPNPQSLDNASGSIKFSGDNNHFTAHSIQGTLGKTTLSGNFTIKNFKAPTIKAKLHANDIEVADFVNLNGALLPIKDINFTTHINMKGIDKQFMPSTLNGTLQANVDSMTLKGIDIGKMLSKIDEALGSIGHGGSNALQIISQLQKMTPKGRVNPDNGQETHFNQFDILVNVHNGIAQTQKIDLTGPNMSVQGGGTVNLNQQTINLIFSAFNPQDIQKTQQQGLPAIKIPLFVKGTFKQPHYGIDWQLLQGQIANYLAKSLIGQSLKNLIGSGSNSTGTQQHPNIGKVLQDILGK